MDENANNYNPLANIDDDSCTYDILGCMDEDANNYNPLANIDDDSCTYDILGCMDEDANNYNPLANIDDGSCISVVNGCTDEEAFNYNPLANTDDGSCISVVNGCTDEEAFNYNPLANTDDGSCIPVINGCTDEDAFNYNPLANTDDGSCIAVVNGCTDVNANNYNENANVDDDSCTYDLLGCTDANANNFNPLANVDDGTCTYDVEGCTDANANNFNPLANVDDGTCTYDVEGCTDANADNFNPNANVDDGSCIYSGCMDQLALNYNAQATIDDNSCEYKYPWHENILTTYFWVGEAPGEENSWVDNFGSAWDSKWMEHFGGVDDPDCRDGYHPCTFTPLENPFYCALPYSDFDDEGPKADRADVVPWFGDIENVDNQKSVIKNRWIRIKFNDEYAYCQWSDAGPGSNDDTAYVFGDSQPVHWDEIGLDTSPAIRDYLGMDGMDLADWQFVDDQDVPDGPWTDTITTTSTCWIYGGSPCQEEDTLFNHNVNTVFNNEAKDRKYFVYEPAACKNEDTDCPLLFMFHGLGGTAAGVTGNTYGWQQTADDNNFMVAFPDSLTLEAKNFGDFSDPAGKHWDITPLIFSETQDTKFVEEMITEIDSIYGVDETKIFTTGHSYGGYFSYYLNFVLNNKFKAFGSHSAGLIPYDILGFTVYWPAEPKNILQNGNTPAIIIHSSDDTIAPPLFATTLESQMIAKHHIPVQRIDLTNKNHNWDKTKNQVQWDFFLANS